MLSSYAQNRKWNCDRIMFSLASGVCGGYLKQLEASVDRVKNLSLSVRFLLFWWCSAEHKRRQDEWHGQKMQSDWHDKQLLNQREWQCLVVCVSAHPSSMHLVCDGAAKQQARCGNALNLSTSPPISHRPPKIRQPCCDTSGTHRRCDTVGEWVSE